MKTRVLKNYFISMILQSLTLLKTKELVIQIQLMINQIIQLIVIINNLYSANEGCLCSISNYYIYKY